MAAAKPSKIELIATDLPHIFKCDVDETGLLKQIAVIKKFADGSISYIDVGSLHEIDKARLKKIVTSVHATKYDLWELMSQLKLSNGMNALDFFHTNCAKIKRPKGALMTVGGLETVSTSVSDDFIGSSFTDPTAASLAQGQGQFAS